nr:hypothetical protein [Tanacetum cinerariifolium]
KLEKKLKHKRRRVVISSEEEEASLNHEDSPKQGRMIEELDKDENVNLVQSSKQGKAQETVEHRKKFSTASPQTDDDETLAETFVSMKSEGQAGEGSSKEGESLKRSVEEELGQEQKVEEEIAHQEDVEKESSKKDEGRLKRKTSKAREDKDKRQKKQDDLEKLTLMEYLGVISNSEEVINVYLLAVKSPIVSWKSWCGEEVRRKATRRYTREAPVAKAPYRLAPLEMQELSYQLQELADRDTGVNVTRKVFLDGYGLQSCC